MIRPLFKSDKAMDRTQYVLDILEDFWPDEYDAIGPANAKDIVEDCADFEATQASSNIELDALIVVLSAAASFVKNSIDVYNLIVKKKGTKPEPQELEDAVKDTQIEDSSIDPSKKKEIYKAICEQERNRANNDSIKNE